MENKNFDNIELLRLLHGNLYTYITEILIRANTEYFKDKDRKEKVAKVAEAIKKAVNYYVDQQLTVSDGLFDIYEITFPLI